ncbi:MAG: hypothetical protein WD002_08205 [Pseudomonadales bacterium]
MKCLTSGWFLVMVSFLAALTPAVFAAEAQEVVIASYLKNFAKENNIEIEGVERLGRDTFRPPANQKSVDKTLRRALARYNTIEYRGERGIVRVMILGRKGSTIGAMPDDVPFEEPAQESAQKPESE